MGHERLLEGPQITDARRGGPRTPAEEVSNLLEFSRSITKRYVKRHREGDSLEPKPSTGRKWRSLTNTEEKRALCEQLEVNNETEARTPPL